MSDFPPSRLEALGHQQGDDEVDRERDRNDEAEASA